MYQGHNERINTNDITTGVLSVPVTVDDNGTEYKCTLLAGQMGADVILDGTGLQPRCDWMLVHAQAAAAPPPRIKAVQGAHGQEETKDE